MELICLLSENGVNLLKGITQTINPYTSKQLSHINAFRLSPLYYTWPQIYQLTCLFNKLSSVHKKI